jgi:hypothetical protein
MSETKKVEQIEQEAKATELSEEDLENVAGGQASVVNSSRSNIKNNLTAPPTPTPTNPASPFPKTISR